MDQQGERGERGESGEGERQRERILLSEVDIADIRRKQPLRLKQSFHKGIHQSHMTLK